MGRRERLGCHEEEVGPLISDWGFMARGQQLGKRVVCPYVAATSATNAQTPNVDILNIGNVEDEYAHQCQITLCPPALILNLNGPTPTTDSDGLQNLTGEQDNIEAGRTLANVGGTPVNNASDLTYANPLAILRWGIGGGQCEAEIDFSAGAVINLSASWIRLSAMVESPGITTSSFPYVLRAFVGPGTPRMGFNAQRTITVLGDQRAETAVFAIPRFARSVILMGADDNHDLYNGYIRFWRGNLGSGGVGTKVADAFFAGTGVQTPFPIPNGAQYFSILPQIGGAGNLGVNLAVFQLAI